MPDPRPARRYRFGAFEADATTGELRRQGIRIKLNSQPFQVLTLLLDRAGELLTREEISRELWTDGTFVDYEHGVNSAINRIREALGDTAAGPRFVETLARRGYRFIAPVELLALPGEPDAKLASAPTPSSLRASSLTATSRLTPSPEEPGAGFGSRILASPDELPETPYAVVQALFVLFQLMYLAFYVGALANLAEIEELFAILPLATQIFDLLIVTAAILIPARAFLLTAAFFHPPGARVKLLQIWPFLLPFEMLWALSPFLLLHHINFGLAIACTALLVYSPFAQRSLILMGAGTAPHQLPVSAKR
jgi:cholera toxin transcriptional activator